MAYAHQGKLNVYFFKPPHGEPVEPIVAFHLAEDRFYFYGTFTAIVFPFFAVQAFSGLGFQFVQTVVYFNQPVAFSLWHCPRMGQPSQRLAL